MTEGICKGCGLPIRWAKTANNKNMPLDATPTKVAVMRTIDGAEVVELVDGYKPHWASCVNAGSFKGGAR